MPIACGRKLTGKTSNQRRIMKVKITDKIVSRITGITDVTFTLNGKEGTAMRIKHGPFQVTTGNFNEEERNLVQKELSRKRRMK